MNQYRTQIGGTLNNGTIAFGKILWEILKCEQKYLFFFLIKNKIFAFFRLKKI